MQHSAVLIIPAALKPAADAVGAAMGWGEISYTIALTDDGETLTHYGSRPDVSSAFVYTVLLAQGADLVVPDHLTDAVAAMQSALAEAPAEVVDPVIAALIADFSPDPSDPEKPVLWGRDHRDAVLAQHGMAVISDEV